MQYRQEAPQPDHRQNIERARWTAFIFWTLIFTLLAYTATAHLMFYYFSLLGE